MRGNPNRWEIEALHRTVPLGEPSKLQIRNGMPKVGAHVAPKCGSPHRKADKYTPVRPILKATFSFGAKECKK